MRKQQCKIIFIGRSKSYDEIEQIVNASLDEGWELFTITDAPDDSGNRVWLVRPV